MLYMLAVVLVAIFGLAFVWFIINEVNTQVITVGHQVAYSLGTNSSTFDLAETFMSNVSSWLLIIALLGVALWAWRYSQMKGERMYVGG